jgi:hypothetical protein
MLITFSDFLSKQKSDPYWRTEKWEHISATLDVLRSLRIDNWKSLEIGTRGLSLIKTSVVMDKRRTWSPDIRHDASNIPWPFADKQFDIAIGLLVWEHVRNRDAGEAFKELMRVSNSAILSFPYRWNDVPKENCHHKISMKDIRKWTCNVHPTQVVIVGDKRKSLICHWVF